MLTIPDPEPPWLRNPYSLVTLMELLRFHANLFCWASGCLSQAFEQIRSDRHWTPGSQETIASALGALVRESIKLELVSVKSQAERIQRYVNSDTAFSFPEFSRQLIELQTRLTDELEGHVFLAVPSSYRQRYEAPLKEWESVATKFSTTTFDIEEASKCLALGRSTACVFHLMRVMEVGLRFIGQTLGVGGHTWDDILRRIDRELAKRFQDKSEAWRKSEPAFAEAAALLRSVKTAWRNPTMHVDRIHTQEQAADIFSAARAFMRHLATAL
jgi:hypothetical protein